MALRRSIFPHDDVGSVPAWSTMATTRELVTFELTHLLTRLARKLSLKPN
jgi:hypothetical protein